MKKLHVKAHSSIKKYGVIIVSFMSVVLSVQAQEDTAKVKFYDFITNDSVMMYFDNRYNFTGKECARYTRYVRLDEEGNFSGAFVDYESGVVTGRGNYKSGIKNGIFETYYSNGNIKSRGSFKNNKPSGYWDYFYANGKLERQLLFNVSDTFLLEYFDMDGHHLIKGGNGHFKGTVGVASDPYYSLLAFAEGEVVNGEPDGVWTSKLGGAAFYTESFKKGFFVSGKVPERLVKDKAEYFDFSNLDILYQPSYFYRLEEFHTEKCDSDYVSHLKKLAQNKTNRPTGAFSSFESLRSYVQDAIRNVLNSDVRNGNIAEYQAGENLFKISFKISDKGAAIDFKQLTSWGDQFFNPVTNAISLHLNAPAASGPIYLVVVVTKDASNYLTSRFYFDNNPSD